MAQFSDVLLTVDFDRTLTAPDSTIPERNLEAIRFFMERGGIFTLNTGRSVPMSVHNILGRVPHNAPLLLYNGSAAYDPATDSFTQCHTIDLDQKAFLSDLLQQFPELNLEIQGKEAHYLLKENRPWEAYCVNNHCPWDYAALDQIPQPFLKVALNGTFHKPTVASMFDATQEELDLFQRATDYINRHYGDKIDAFRACARILDLHAKGCSKGNAARELQRTLGRKLLVCVGDAENDLTMMDMADYAYCPEDGIIADRYENVCSCAEGAVADVIYKKIPEIA